MRNFTIICCLLIITSISCEKKNDTITKEKYFDPKDIELLSLKNIEGFWDDTDTNIKVSEVNGFFFISDTCFIEGYRYNGNEKGLIISVFETKEIAIAAMEYRIQNVACLILPGEQNGNFEEVWWYSDCIPNCVFVNLWNTIIEVYYYDISFEEVEDILYDTAEEIIQRVDNLSKEID
jgi:hypothetical protein